MAGLIERRLIAVSWVMPPALFPRSIQIARLLKGLKRDGWRSTVITLPAASHRERGPIDDRLAALYSGEYEREPIALRDTVEEPWNLPFRWKHGPLPVAEAHWILDAAAAARQAIWQGAEVLVTFAQPWRDHFVGLAFGRPRLPWVAHFSDPWVDSLYYDDTPGTQRELDASREAAIMHRCDLAVFTNPYAAELVMRKYPEAVRRKARVVPHAWDPEVLPPLGPDVGEDRPRPLRLSYVGALLVGRRTAGDLLAALAHLHSKTGLQGRLELAIVGSGSGTDETRQIVERLGLEALVRFHPHVGYLDSLAAMRRSDVLVVLDAAAATNVFLPSKLADYLMVERAMLAITPEQGPSADLMRACGFPSIAPGNVAAAAEAIERLLVQHESGRSLSIAPAAVANRFRLDAVSSAFAAVLDEAVAAFSWKKRWL